MPGERSVVVVGDHAKRANDLGVVLTTLSEAGWSAMTVDTSPKAGATSAAVRSSDLVAIASRAEGVPQSLDPERLIAVGAGIFLRQLDNLSGFVVLCEPGTLEVTAAVLDDLQSRPGSIVAYGATEAQANKLPCSSTRTFLPYDASPASPTLQHFTLRAAVRQVVEQLGSLGSRRPTVAMVGDEDAQRFAADFAATTAPDLETIVTADTPSEVAYQGQLARHGLVQVRVLLSITGIFDRVFDGEHPYDDDIVDERQFGGGTFVILTGGAHRIRSSHDRPRHGRFAGRMAVTRTDGSRFWPATPAESETVGRWIRQRLDADGRRGTVLVINEIPDVGLTRVPTAQGQQLHRSLVAGLRSNLRHPQKIRITEAGIGFDDPRLIGMLIEEVQRGILGSRVGGA